MGLSKRPAAGTGAVAGTGTDTGTAAQAVIAVAAALALGLVACANDDSRTGSVSGPDLAGIEVTVGSADSDESTVVAELYAQALEAKGATVNRDLRLGARADYYPLLQDGTVSLVPEHTYELLSFLTGTTPPERAARDQLDALQRALPAELRVLTPSPAENKDAIACREEVVDQFDLVTEADLAALEASEGELSERDCTAAPSASALIETDGLVVLLDEELRVPNNAVVPLVRTELATPAVQVVLDAVSSTLVPAELVGLLAEVEDGAADPADAAREWLSDRGLASR